MGCRGWLTAVQRACLMPNARVTGRWDVSGETRLASSRLLVLAMLPQARVGVAHMLVAAETLTLFEAMLSGAALSGAADVGETGWLVAQGSAEGTPRLRPPEA